MVFVTVTNHYTSGIRRMVKHPLIFIIIFVTVINATFLIFLSQPTGFLPTEDQGFGILVTRLPEGASQPRLLETSDKVNAILKKTPGLIALSIILVYMVLAALYESWTSPAASSGRRSWRSILRKKVMINPA